MTDLALDLILVVCLAAVAVGVGLIFMPAGLIVGGALGACASIYYARGIDRRDRQINSPRAGDTREP